MSQIFPTTPYKGTRDLYPDELLKRNYIFDTWRKALVVNGFSEYDSSIIENAEAFIAKSGEELGSQQLYSFTDKGDRKIALRPELTLSFARLVADKFDQLKFPVRLFSIANCFRYERPQKGRMREFYQMEVNIAGAERGPVDLEILNLSSELFKAFGAKKEQYKILYNSRLVLDEWTEKNGWTSSRAQIYKILDSWYKQTEQESLAKLSDVVSITDAEKIIRTAKKEGQAWQEYLEIALNQPEMKLILETLPIIQPNVNLEFTATIIRGQAYYTGLIFEAFDTNKENSRSLFGGGRFDDLLDIYGKKAGAIGFAPGDITWSEFLENWKLWPEKFDELEKVGILPFSQEDLLSIYSNTIPALKEKGKTFEIDYSFSRSENKRYESLKKKGCGEIVKIGF
jgi:histidyl-tRNA synthetase